MHRARFLEKLVQGIPKHVTHLNKRLVKISSSNSPSKPSSPDPPPSSAGPITLHFADGTSETTDAVIGAEGIRSVVREYVLGKELAEPVFANAVVFRNIRKMEDVIDKLGEEYAGKASILCGPSEFTHSSSSPSFLFPLSHSHNPGSQAGLSPTNQSINQTLISPLLPSQKTKLTPPLLSPS